MEITPIHAGAIVPPLPSAALEGYKILLASNSPRRRELLGLVIGNFEIAEGRKVDESYPESMNADEVPAFLSQLKAAAYADILQPAELLITADTVVIDGGEILGKPHGREEAVEMLCRLAGHAHTVVTGVTLTTVNGKQTFSEHTLVEFAPISRKVVEEYVDLYRPYDKAGAYGIQEWIGAVAIKGVQGCFYNVMGLPLNSLYTHLRDFKG